MSLILALCAIPFCFCFVGCGNPSINKATDGEKALNNYQYAVSQMANLTNFTIDVTQKDKEVETITNASGVSTNETTDVSYLLLQADSSSVYIYDYVDNQVYSNFIINNSAIYDMDDEYNTMTVNGVLGSKHLSGAVKYMYLTNGLYEFKTLAQSLQANVLSLPKDNNGVVVTLAMTAWLNKTLANYNANKDKQILVFLNQLLKDTFKKDVTVENLVNKLTSQYTSETTVEDALSILNDEFGVDLTFVMQMLLYSNTDAYNLYGEDVIYKKISELISDKDMNAQELNKAILDKLLDEDLTLDAALNDSTIFDNNIIEVIIDEYSEMIDNLKSDYGDLNNISFDNAVLSWTAYLDDNNIIDSMFVDNSYTIIKTNAADNTTLSRTISQTMDARFKDINKTVVSLPGEINEVNVTFDVDLSKVDATAEMYDLDMSGYVALGDDLEFLDGADVVATYSNESKTFSVSVEYLKTKYLADEDAGVYLEKDNHNYTFNFDIVNSTI